MSSIFASIKNIENKDSLNIVSFDFFGNTLKMMSLELSNKVQVGTKVLLGVKPTSIVLAKEFSGQISFVNTLQGKIINIDMGALLCNVKVEISNCVFEAIITKKSALSMDLKVEDEVTIFIKESELSIVEVYND